MFAHFVDLSIRQLGVHGQAENLTRSRFGLPESDPSGEGFFISGLFVNWNWIVDQRTDLFR